MWHLLERFLDGFGDGLYLLGVGIAAYPGIIIVASMLIIIKGYK